MILLIDNYDSFTYNLVQRLGEIDPGVELKVVRNDQISPEDIERFAPSRLIISPGPCTPIQAGISNEVVKRFAPSIPLLGVCLGHQCIGHSLGAEDRSRAGQDHARQNLRSSITTAAASIAGWQIHLKQLAITAWSSSPAPCRTISKSWLGRIMMRSWACATRNTRSREFNTIPRAFSRSKGSSSSATLWSSGFDDSRRGSQPTGVPTPENLAASFWDNSRRACCQ